MSRAGRQTYWIGCDIGSTAVKVVVTKGDSTLRLAEFYERHGTRQTDSLLRLLARVAKEFPEATDHSVVAFTGSGGRPLAECAGARFLQEVNAVAIATERLHPEAGSVVDLGGQDAKMIIWMREGGSRRKFFSMNDKCAGGTGSVIDRIAAKLGIPDDQLRGIRLEGKRIHRVAARCGVFAETDINSLQKQGVPRDELMASLFEAIVQQNLSVLARGTTLIPPVLLLGGPNAFLPGLQDAWHRNLLALWEERGFRPGNGHPPVVVPDSSCFFAAIGAVLEVQAEADGVMGPSLAEVRKRLAAGLCTDVSQTTLPPLIKNRADREWVANLARQEPALGFRLCRGPVARVLVGLDAGSTSTKAVAMDEQRRLLAKAYRLSGGDPVDDARHVLQRMRDEAAEAGKRLEIAALGVTGYAKDILGEFIGADMVLVETVAHARSALEVDPDVDVIVDVGGQDIKVMVLRDGRVRDFRLNTQCSAGNGYFLQSTAQRFGIPLERFADAAFSAQRVPRFNFGCAVFLEADIVNFQQMGWRPEEILAGLARVLPQNVWLYVVGEPNLERLGRSFMLQGGTQRNEAAVKAQVDFITERVEGARIRVHPHAGESGAIGVVLEMMEKRLHERGSRFVGFEALEGMTVSSRQDESTRCKLCPNRCPRTILTARLPGGEPRHFVVASCERGRVLPGMEKSRALKKPSGTDLSLLAARTAFDARVDEHLLPVREPRKPWRGLAHFLGRRKGVSLRNRIRIGIPRALNLYQVAPFFVGYLRALGVPREGIVFSGRTTEELFREGMRRGSIDTCYPSKLALAHVHDLLFKKKCDWIFFPVLIDLPGEVEPAVDQAVCPTSQAAPEVVKAAFTRETDTFSRMGKRYFDPHFHMNQKGLLEGEMLSFWGPLLGVSAAENREAIEVGFRVMEARLARLQARALAEIRKLEKHRRVGIVLLARPYHDDPGLNHGIVERLVQLGYPVIPAMALPREPGFLNELFGSEVEEGLISGPMDISDVWKNSFSANSNLKVWAAKVVARHRNLVALDLSSFRCGHDAPIYSTIEAIMEASHTPYFTFHEIDENRPTGAIKLRVETIHYFLKQYEREVLGRVDSEVRNLEEVTEPAMAGAAV